MTQPTVIDVPAQEDRCSQCGAEFENIGHPLKPGVIMQRHCKCEVVTICDGATSVTMLVPPARS